LHALNTSVDSSLLPNIVQLRSAPEAWTTKLKASKKNESDKSTASLHEEKARMASQDKPSEVASTMAKAFMASANHTPPTALGVWIFVERLSDTGVFSGSLRPHSGHVKFANGERGAISGIGTAKLRCQLPGDWPFPTMP